MNSAGVYVTTLLSTSLGLSALLWARTEIGNGPAWFDTLSILLSSIAAIASLIWLLPSWRRRFVMSRDDLCGLPSRAEAMRQLKRLKVKNTALAIFADIDGLKAINDTHGHLEGDKCIVALANAIKHLQPPPYTAARVGGDEFFALLVDADESSVRRQLATIQSCLANPVDGTTKPFGFSYGLCPATKAALSVTHMMAQADKAMYDQKRSPKPIELAGRPDPTLA
jgi:diguanylate cyclase (GGDEF)-like protein